MQENFIAITIHTVNAEQADMLIAQLTAIDFDGFEEANNTIKAFITEEKYNEPLLKEIAIGHNIEYTTEKVATKNWNEEWEKNFDPVLIDDFVAVRAHFHKAITGVMHEIIITPKMSFGTGHHATTYLVMREMRNINFNGKTVFDFGTGTGILSILAEKLNARSVLAIDNDTWSMQNARENLAANACDVIRLLLADAPPEHDPFDIIIANINKNVILHFFSTLTGLISKKGLLILSGLLMEDEQDILSEASRLGIDHQYTTYKNNWICIKFSN